MTTTAAGGAIAGTTAIAGPRPTAAARSDAATPAWPPACSAAGEGDPAAIIGGTLAGILVGATLGQGIDLQDSYCMGETLHNAPDGSTIIWNNPRTEASYEVTPKASYEREDGRYCREFISNATVAGKEQQVYGTACWQPDGSWEIVKAK